MAQSGDAEVESLSDSGGSDDDRESLVRRRHPNIDIRREPQNELRFEAGFSRAPKKWTIRDRLNSALPPEPIRSALTPPLSQRAWLEFFLVHVPIIRWVWSYQARFLVNDVISGITVAIMHIPQGLAYALLANLHPVYGLYASFMPAIVYSFFGSSRHISVGTFAVVQLMIGNSIVKVMSSDPTLQPCLNLGSQQNNGSDSCFSNHDDIMAGDGSTPFGGVMSSNEDEVPNITAEVCDAERATIAITIAMLSGVIMLLMGLLQLGFISIFLSESLVSGYTTGAACHVFTSQLKHVLGIDNGVHPGILQVPRIWIKSIYQLCHTNPATFIIAIVTMAVLIAINILNKWLKKRKIPMVSYSRGQRKFSVKRVKWTIPVPGPLVVLIGATLISFLASFEKNFDVIIVGEIPQGAPALTNPFTSYISLPLIIDSFVISIVVYSVSVSLARKFANEHDYAIHSNQEFIAYGAMNVIGSFFSSFTAAGSLSRSLIQSTAGKTQLVGFISSAIILIVLLWLGALFEPLPTAVLAATIWVALWGMFRQFRHTWSYFKLSFSDFLIWVVVFLATVFLGVDLGLGVGVAFSLLVIIFRIVLPYSSVLGQAKDTEIFRNTKYFEVDTVKGVLIFRFMAPICFMNAAVFRTRLEMECDLHKRQKPGGEEKGCLQKCLPPPEQWCGGRGGYDVTEVHTEEELQGHIETASDRDLRVAPRAKRKQLVHSVVIDCAPISFLDAVGVNALKQLVLDFYKCDVQVVFASMTKENRDMMDRAKFYEVCGKEWLFPSIQDAVHHACFSSTLHPAVEVSPSAEEERESELTMGNGESQTPRLELEEDTQQQQQQQQQQEEEAESDQLHAATSFTEPQATSSTESYL